MSPKLQPKSDLYDLENFCSSLDIESMPKPQVAGDVNIDKWRKRKSSLYGPFTSKLLKLFVCTDSDFAGMWPECSDFLLYLRLFDHNS